MQERIIVRFTKGKRGFWLLRWRDPFGKDKEKQTEIPARDKLRNEAAKAAADWETYLNTPVSERIDRTTWSEFCKRYESEFLAGNSKGHIGKWNATKNRIFKSIKPGYVDELTAQVLSKWIQSLRSEKLSDATIDGHCTYIMTALDWAESMAMIGKKPKIKAAKQVKRRTNKKSKSKGRPISGEEFDRLLKAAEQERPDDYQYWQWVLKAFWNSGLRLNEAMILSWNWQENFSVCLETRMFSIRGDGQKNGESQLLPIAPEFVEQLLEIPERSRSGLVFNIPYSHWWTSEVICKIGEKSGIKVAPNKFVSAQDLRRSFATRWVRRGLSVYDLKELMRHKDIKTTMEYYAQQETEELRDRILSKYETELSRIEDSGQSVGKSDEENDEAS